MSYGTNAPFGFQPRQYLNGSLWTGQQSEYLINGNLNGTLASYATNIYTGDLVKLAVDGTIQLAAVGDPSIGVFFGCKYFDSSNTLVFKPYWPASTATYAGSNPVAFVIDDPDVLFSAQVLGTGTVTGNINTINIGLNGNGTYQSELNYNYNIAIGTGNTLSGNSGATANLATQATTATLQLKLVRLEPRIGNTFGLTFNNGLFLINNHIYKGGTGTAGI